PYQVVPLADVLTPFGAGGSGTGQERALLMQNLWATHFEPAWQMGSSWTTPQRLRAEAFAAALWEIVYETPANGFDVTTGRVRIGSIDTSTANAWLRGLDPNGPQTLLRALSNGQYQDYVTAIPGVGGMQPIGGHAPEPVTLAGLLLGIGTVARYVRRRTARPGPPSRRCT
ncbi:MAG: PEP-CTERM sorting domain-containing protein, partial [Chloroflexi bacterium]|nr:PEP-CTERM sorting domain-containing protein [Chloroflexota bacterium]